MRIHLGLLLAAVVASAPAGAVTLSIGGVALLPGPSGNTQGLGSAQSGALLVDGFNDGHATGVSTRFFGFSSTNVLNRHNAPAGDASGYAFLNALKATGEINFLLPRGQRIDYVGFYLGSVDSYNYVSFFDKNGVKLDLSFGAISLGQELSGTQIVVTAAGLPVGDLTDPANKANLFLNFAFDNSEQVARIQFRQTNFATEIDNLTWRFAPATNIATNVAAVVDAPGSTAIVALGLLGIAGVQMRKRRG